MFSTRLTGMPSSRSAVDGGIAELPTLTLSTHEPIPRRLDLAALDAGIGERLVERLGHQLVGARVPALAEARAAHAEDGDLVLDAALPCQLLLARRTAASLSRNSGDSRAPIALLDAEHHRERRADLEPARADIDELHQQPRAVVELHEADVERRAG